ncbi:hypothetical protein BROC_00926 [Candidatus Brocadiaceae bacterium]|nr:hypothetical protein BROC_00926 [Candidatus Brocadiaceae bacterium]
MINNFIICVCALYLQGISGILQITSIVLILRGEDYCYGLMTGKKRRYNNVRLENAVYFSQ